MSPNNPISLALWFHTQDGSISEVLSYYKNIFWENFTSGNTIPLGQTPSGYAEMCEVILFERKYNFLSTQKVHMQFNDALSLIITCKNQEEIDTYWEYFTREWQEVQCGWCNDKFALRWQIIPENLGELLSRPGAQQVMYRQKKIIISEYT